MMIVWDSLDCMLTGRFAEKSTRGQWIRAKCKLKIYRIHSCYL